MNERTRLYATALLGFLLVVLILTGIGGTYLGIPAPPAHWALTGMILAWFGRLLDSRKDK